MRLNLLSGVLLTALACSGGQGDDDTPDGSRDAGDASQASDGGDGSLPTEGCALTCERVFGACECVRPPVECSTDDDCVVGRSIATCCDNCPEAYPRTVLESELCLVVDGDAIRACTPPVCPDDLECATPRCPPVARAACVGGRCTASTECADDQVLVADLCQPRCESAADCVAAVGGQSCCGSCPRAMHRALLTDRPCLVPMGEQAPAICSPAPEQCEGVECPAVECPGVGTLACNDGRCALN